MSVFRYDLVRTARRGRSALVRTAYALALLVALGGLFVRWFPGGLAPDRLFADATLAPGATGRFARDFAATCLLVQFAAAALLTPAYAAGAIAEERQRGTLDFLLAADLSGAAIVFGKFAARWLAVAGLLLTGLPVLALTQLWGGVDWGALAFGFGVTLLTTFSLTGLGVLFSVRARSVREAAVTTYAVAAGLAMAAACVPVLQLGSPLYAWAVLVGRAWGFVGGLEPWPVVLLGYAIGHIAVGLIALVWAAWLIRPQPLSKAERDLLVRASRRLPAGAVIRSTLLPHPLVGPPLRRRRQPLRRNRVLRVPPVGDDALLWKELHFGGGSAASELWRTIGYALIGVALTVGLARGMAAIGTPVGLREDLAWESAARAANPAGRDMSLAILTAVMVGTALRAAVAVGRERERRTLDTLRILPGGSAAVLRAKWLGSALSTRWLAAGLVVAWLVTIPVGMLPPAAVFWLALAGAVHVAFLTSLGLYCSVAARGTGRAAVAALVGLAATWAAPLVAANYWLGLTGPGPHRRWVAAVLEEGLVPPLTWRYLAAAAADPPPPGASEARLAGALVGLAAYAAAAWVLWRLARRRFRRQRG
ncbi:MAG TPA: ABC transporter permease [Gemmataceae bacterium]|jgi:ABC-type Na+ efflux pump permease subunit